ncbi:MAG: helix-turn-helix domain-containing protein [Candidatus Cloacimonadaceae bacterium]|jgi:cytoskeletal protein RodZ|nr:helix-turn-helix domain-containing protein [Candidatus Cloacimonadota bacterium]MDY0127781.1 helix-turn-helix domain-containing protein [Candidatus Cloacimonadaceae bacterium]MCB5254201.1 helix-turn-helix domain-containing protein [Candidatus Cloacimonadota bacterium]MCK9178765.1 helix-turn-helix domain-containing protein [Candidatus Cloacimonadota bacterium]MCK9243446.1 helix-turn-helix domain-containing protein [Candidatus Cloacimonadota bacterium]
MEDLGKYLLNLRLERGVSYAEIWTELKISEDQIKAIEENRLSQMGPYGFVKALLYTYARYLEADLSSVMTEFRIMLPEHTKKEFTPRRDLKEKKIMLSTNFLWTVGIIIFVMILGSILLHAYQQGWLRTPNFFKKDKPAQTEEIQEKEESPKPDSLHLRMRALSESIPQSNVLEGHSLGSSMPADTTDYIGQILGDSPVNVQIN